MRGEIVERVQPAMRLQGRHHVVGDLALVEAVTALFGDDAQGFAEFGLLHDIAGDRRLAVRQQVARRIDAAAQLLKCVLPVERDTRRDDVALFRRLDRGLQQRIEAELAVIA